MEVNGREGQQHDQESSEWFVKYLNRQGDWLEKTRGNLMVAATVIASMSFQVMVNPPGGVWQGGAADSCSSQNQNNTCYDAKVGTAVLQNNDSRSITYHGMVISSTVSFTASMSLILLVISGFQLRNRMIMAILVTFMVIAVLCMSAAFYFAVALVQSENRLVVLILGIYFLFWIGLVALLILVQLVRFLCWLLCFLCCCCRRRPTLRPTRRPIVASGSTSSYPTRSLNHHEINIVSAL